MLFLVAVVLYFLFVSVITDHACKVFQIRIDWHDYLSYLEVQVLLCCVGCHSGKFNWHAGIFWLKTELISVANACEHLVNCTAICRQGANNACSVEVRIG